MRIVSLNINRGGGSRINSLTDWLLAQKAEAIMIQEWRGNPAGHRLRAALEADGYRVDVIVRPTPRSNGLLNAIRAGSSCYRMTPIAVSNGELLQGQINGTVTVVNAHIPVKTDKPPFFQELTNLANASINKPLLLIGDFNTGCHQRNRQGSYRFVCADQFDALTSQAKLIDLWRREHPDCREWSWHSGKNGFRIDHVFANAAFIERHGPIDCRYDHEPRIMKLTDHSAMIVECARQ